LPGQPPSPRFCPTGRFAKHWQIPPVFAEPWQKFPTGRFPVLPMSGKFHAFLPRFGKMQKARERGAIYCDRRKTDEVGWQGPIAGRSVLPTSEWNIENH
jgi:hypothetical protein